MDVLINGFVGYFHYLVGEITFQSTPWWKNYFWWLVLISVLFGALEWLSPWRRAQPLLRRDFWLDAFYMFFNFSIFWLIGYNAVSDVVSGWVRGGFAGLGVDIFAQNPMAGLPYWAVLVLGFVVRDFVQWNVHRLLHRSAWLWEFHKVHHSVAEMGFAAHLRYHWMETIVYRTIEYLPLAFLGIGLYDFFLIHIFTIAVGHHNHANFFAPSWAKGAIWGFLLAAFAGLVALSLDGTGLSLCLVAGAGLGALAAPIWPYVFNSPEMHIWHHAHDLPDSRPHGVNFGITLACWDYIFGSNYQPHDGRDIRLGFPGVEGFPQTFADQVKHGF